MCKISECVLCVTVFMRISGYRVCVCVCVAACNSMGDIAGQRKEMNEQFGGVERDGGGEKVS